MLVTCMYMYLFVWSYIPEDIRYSYCLDQSHYKADVISNTKEYPSDLNIIKYSVKTDR